jgi:hypothetical protein
MTLPLARPDQDRLQLPDVRRQVQMPSLPAWVDLRIASLKTEPQPNPETGKWERMLTVPVNLALTQMQRTEIEQHARKLRDLCVYTPTEHGGAEKEVLAVVTELMLVLPSQAQNDLSAEARGAAFMSALDDLTPWAVRSAVRRWHRSDCGLNVRGQPYDYHWCPAPAELRSIAFIEMHRLLSRVQTLERLLAAKEHREFDDEHCATMRKRLADHFRTLTPLVGKDGSGGAAGPKPVAGAHCGTRPKAQPGLEREGGRRRRGDRRK